MPFTHVSELAELPVGTLVIDSDADAWYKTAPDLWAWVGDGRDGDAAYLLRCHGPVSLWTPPTTHMVRCCAQGCPNTAALQPGSSYLCPDHGDGGCSDTTITSGGSR